jgi:DNA-binding SARP family transcriptional activator
MLARELGIDPSAGLQDLYHQILGGTTDHPRRIGRTGDRLGSVR